MTADELRAAQAPLKSKYRESPATAVVTMRAAGRLDPTRQAVTIQTARPGVPVGLHPAAGGDGSMACSGDMLLESLVGCAGTTLGAVATAMGLKVQGGTITATGDVDFRGTLGVSKEVAVGFTDIRIEVVLEGQVTAEQAAKLLELTERYCVVFQTLRQPPHLSSRIVP
jgi:uncharacterized OsmC-like protein